MRKNLLEPALNIVVIPENNCRDGLERLEISEAATVDHLRQAIHEKLGIPLSDLTLSTSAQLLTEKDVTTFKDFQNGNSTLNSLGVHHGDIIFMLYSGERQIPGVARSEFEKRPFGAHMDINAMVAAQTRIERQDAAVAKFVSFDRHAANVFQTYLSAALAFSIKRGGILYGSVDEDGGVSVEAIWEPPQQGSAATLELDLACKEAEIADYVAKSLGLEQVGWIFNQVVGDRDFIFDYSEIEEMASIQSKMGRHAVTGLVAIMPGETEGDPPEVHFEAFQVSEQCENLWEAGWFQNKGRDEMNGYAVLRDPKDPKNKTPVIVAGKDLGEVDNDYFLVPVPIRDHDGPLSTNFPVENRLLPQGSGELRKQLQKHEQFNDFHLLLYLAKEANFSPSDIEIIGSCVRNDEKMPDGYKIIVDSLAGM